MSEKLPKSPEKLQQSKEIVAPRPEAAAASAEQQAEQLASARQEVAAQAAERPVIADEPAVERPHFIDNTVKALRMKKSMQSIQTRLHGPNKQLSKAVHQPLVQKVSEQAAKTVTRPSGLLGGGIVAFFGSLSYVVFTQHYGYAYNYGLFLLLFVGGFIVGIIAEYAVHWLRLARRKHLLKQSQRLS